jgi:hypothetical protein
MPTPFPYAPDTQSVIKHLCERAVAALVHHVTSFLDPGAKLGIFRAAVNDCFPPYLRIFFRA